MLSMLWGNGGPSSKYTELGRQISSWSVNRPSSGDIATYVFRRFGLKLPIYALVFGISGAYFPDMTPPVVLTEKSTVLWWNTTSTFKPIA